MACTAQRYGVASGPASDDPGLLNRFRCACRTMTIAYAKVEGTAEVRGFSLSASLQAVANQYGQHPSQRSIALLKPIGLASPVVAPKTYGEFDLGVPLSHLPPSYFHEDEYGTKFLVVAGKTRGGELCCLSAVLKCNLCDASV